MRDRDGQWCLNAEGKTEIFDAGKDYRKFMDSCKEYCDNSKKAVEVENKRKAEASAKS